MKSWLVTIQKVTQYRVVGKNEDEARGLAVTAAMGNGGSLVTRGLVQFVDKEVTVTKVEAEKNQNFGLAG